jgi:hypothetical protein
MEQINGEEMKKNRIWGNKVNDLRRKRTQASAT